ncbi:hypothetical protein [Pedobacter alpinus]|uniref:Uncharacterized protein n=1 Tax=Pedobacter alpinus TaxID=1590643 RepID=A0ABW5TTQ7_9SPHI
MRDDLNASLGMDSHLAYRKVNAWVLQKTGNIEPAKPERLVNTLAGEQAIKELRNTGLASLVSYYNWKEGHIPVLDETGFGAKVSLKLDVADLEDLAAVNNALAPYHLRFTIAERNLEFIIIKENR